MSDFKGHSNLRDIFAASVKEAPNKPFLGTRAQQLTDKNETVYGDY